MGLEQNVHVLPEVNAKDERYQAIKKITFIGSVVDLFLGVIKVTIGSLANSQALIADGIHSLSDLATNILVIFAAKHGSKEADSDHPYGHGRYETLATVVLGLILISVGIGIGIDSSERLLDPQDIAVPGIAALLVAAVSVISKELIFQYTLRVGKRLNSRLLIANAWHSRTDAISSIIVIIGISGTMAGFSYLDGVAAIVVALMIIKIGWDLVAESIHELMDTALDSERVDEIRKLINKVDGVKELHTLRTRLSGGEALVDVHILVNPYLSVSEGHYVSESVRSTVVRNVSEVYDVLVHIDPEDDEKNQPSVGLPTRSQLINALEGCWDKSFIDEIRRNTIHYLDGKVEMEIFLDSSLDLSAEKLLEYKQQGEHHSMIDNIRFYNALN